MLCPNFGVCSAPRVACEQCAALLSKSYSLPFTSEIIHNQDSNTKGRSDVVKVDPDSYLCVLPFNGTYSSFSSSVITGSLSTFFRVAWH